ncbi:MAG: hypothetical protein ACTSUE_13550 [Promethearchaeota archaeon]
MPPENPNWTTCPPLATKRNVLESNFATRRMESANQYYERKT